MSEAQRIQNEMNDLGEIYRLKGELLELRDQRDRLCSALRAALDDVPGWVELARAALTPAGGGKE